MSYKNRFSRIIIQLELYNIWTDASEKSIVQNILWSEILLKLYILYDVYNFIYYNSLIILKVIFEYSVKNNFIRCLIYKKIIYIYIFFFHRCICIDKILCNSNNYFLQISQNYYQAVITYIKKNYLKLTFIILKIIEIKDDGQ